MASTFSPNVQIEEPARGDSVGTWDTPVNGNSTLLDLILGGTATISLNIANVTLAAPQFRSANIVFNSTLAASVLITFPTSFQKPYTIQNLCTGSSNFTVTLLTTAAGGQAVACPPGQPFDIINDGTNIKFKNFGPPVGGYIDWAGSSVPNWNDGCTIRPYRNCDGTAVSSTEHPTLFGLIGATLPDARGRGAVYNNLGTGRMTSSQGGLDGNTLFAGGGSQTTTLSSLHLPQLASLSHTHTVNNPAGGGSYMVNTPNTNPQFASGAAGFTQIPTMSTELSSITYGSTGQIGAPVIQPAVVTGLRLIRSA